MRNAVGFLWQIHLGECGQSESLGANVVDASDSFREEGVALLKGDACKRLVVVERLCAYAPHWREGTVGN